jgi:hypothetical protein
MRGSFGENDTRAGLQGIGLFLSVVVTRSGKISKRGVSNVPSVFEPFLSLEISQATSAIRDRILCILL